MERQTPNSRGSALYRAGLAVFVPPLVASVGALGGLLFGGLGGLLFLMLGHEAPWSCVWRSTTAVGSAGLILGVVLVLDQGAISDLGASVRCRDRRRPAAVRPVRHRPATAQKELSRRASYRARAVVWQKGRLAAKRRLG
jgi:hypothetical protein